MKDFTFPYTCLLYTSYRDLREAQRNGKTTDEEVKAEVSKISKHIRSIISPLVVRLSLIHI